MKKYSTIDEYISASDKSLRSLLEELRSTIQKAVPDAKEKIAYGIPTFTFHGNLVHFAGYKDHIGFYPGSAPIKQFANQLKSYQTSKGTVRFPLDQPLPLTLITEMTKACVERNLSKS